MKRVSVILAVCLLVALASYAGQRAANAYKATKLTTNSVLISCNDEREPNVSHTDSTATAIVVTCKQ